MRAYVCVLYLFHLIFFASLTCQQRRRRRLFPTLADVFHQQHELFIKNFHLIFSQRIYFLLFFGSLVLTTFHIAFYDNVDLVETQQQNNCSKVQEDSKRKAKQIKA